jgi:heme exporter protein A
VTGSGLVAEGVAALRGERLVFRDVSLAVAPGGALLLLGPNGSGKSTLLRLLAGLGRPEAGRVTWNGAEVREARVAYLGHLDAVKPALTVRETLDDAAAESVGALGLAPLLDVPGRMLSAGQKRRVALARLAASGAGAWLLDEPTLGLDAASVAALGRLLAGHRVAGGVVVAATHLPLPLPDAAELHLAGA